MANWNWQKIVVPGSKQFNLPDFKKSVLLVEKRDDKFYGVVGSLESLDIDGPHWNTGTNSFSEIFGNIFNIKQQYETTQFNPTYWCVIQLPEDEKKPETNGKGK